jgi:hypothetical protein
MIRYLLDPEIQAKPSCGPPVPSAGHANEHGFHHAPAARHFVNAKQPVTVQRCRRGKRPQERLVHPSSVK